MIGLNNTCKFKARNEGINFAMNSIKKNQIFATSYKNENKKGDIKTDIIFLSNNFDRKMVETPEMGKEKEVKSSDVKSAARLFGVSKRSMRQKQENKIQQIHDNKKS